MAAKPEIKADLVRAYSGPRLFKDHECRFHRYANGRKSRWRSRFWLCGSALEACLTCIWNPFLSKYGSMIPPESFKSRTALQKPTPPLSATIRIFQWGRGPGFTYLLGWEAQNSPQGRGPGFARGRGPRYNNLLCLQIIVEPPVGCVSQFNCPAWRKIAREL
jgi:hypothetical protein